MNPYADTSFLVSLYVLDVNSARAASRMRGAALPVLITPFGELELANAVSFRFFRRELTGSQAKAAVSLFREDLRNGVFLSKTLPASAFERATRIALRRTPRLGTRSLDILHVASALAFKAAGFYTFDERQAKLAAAEGLRVL